MKHLQKIKPVHVYVYYAKNGHFKDTHTFNRALDAKRYVEQMAAITKTEMLFIIHDEHNELYRGDGKKV